MAGDTVVALVLEVDSGIYNTLRLVTLEADGIGTEHTVSADGVPSVYEAAIALIDEHHAVLSWSQGDNPAFRVWAEQISW